MSAFASFTVPIDLTRRSNAVPAVFDAVDTYPGTRNTVVDEAASNVRFEMQFPGNLSGLVARLRGRLIPTGDAVGITLPVFQLVPEILENEPHRLAELVDGEGPEVWDPAFIRGRWIQSAKLGDGTVSATIVATTDGTHELYDVLLHLGFLAGTGFDEADAQ